MIPDKMLFEFTARDQLVRVVAEMDETNKTCLSFHFGTGAALLIAGVEPKEFTHLVAQLLRWGEGKGLFIDDLNTETPK